MNFNYINSLRLDSHEPLFIGQWPPQNNGRNRIHTSLWVHAHGPLFCGRHKSDKTVGVSSTRPCCVDVRCPVLRPWMPCLPRNKRCLEDMANDHPYSAASGQCPAPEERRLWSEETEEMADSAELDPRLCSEDHVASASKRLKPDNPGCLSPTASPVKAATAPMEGVQSGSSETVLVDGEVPLEDTHPAAAPSQPTRRRLDFPAEAGLTPAQQYTWFASLLKQHGELEPLFKEGRLRPYLTVRDDIAFYKRLLTEGLFDVVLVENAAERQHTVIIHNVPLYMNANLIETPDNFLWLKRRYAGTAPRPQLLGAVVGHVPTEVHLLGVGRKAVEPYTAEPDICRHCCRWGHQEWRCRSAPRCRYCAGTHKSALCLQKIQAGTPVPRKCCNCGGEHNAHYHSCPMKPKPSRVAAPDHHPQQGRPRLVFRPAPLPQSSAWARGAPTTSEFPPLPGLSAPAAPASPAATPVPRQAPAPAPQPQPTVPPVPAAGSPAVAGSTPVHQILAAVTQLQETLAATISRVAALEQRVSTPPPVRELSSIPAPAPASAPAPCPALPSAGEAMDADSGDSVVPPAGQMQNTPATPPAVVTAAAEGTAEPRHGQTGPSPSPADPPLQWEATLQVLLAQFASLTQQVAELHHRITPLLDRQPPPPDQCLLSDHFALETTIPIQPAPAVSRKRLAVPAAGCRASLPKSGVVPYCEGILYRRRLAVPRPAGHRREFCCSWQGPSRPKRRLQTYASDPAVSNCQRTLASYQRRWQQDPPIGLPAMPWSLWRATSLNSDKLPGHETGSPSVLAIA
ncbi:uncharacterized protein LOC126997794 [Eriocheir sinensis]|uniref:uncharacterized protein LOC126997794 n=1 Tax=Eriocheir sinensis TaxID=95602 RepID=UPI0021C82110|nr:uncharacterized protein LOC126997794 [Eriocheir sinensis]